MNNEKKMGFATLQIHAGNPKNTAGALCAPIYQTSTFVFDTVEQGGNRFDGLEPGYIYTRLSNPSLNAVEDKIAALEGGEAAIAAASGMGAITSAIYSLVKSGDEIIADETLYGCTYNFMSKGLANFGVKVHFVDLSKPENMKACLNENTKVIYFETPCNPNMKIVDIQAVADMAHAYNSGIQVVVDNTFASPYIQKPLSLGADVVVHSATKYINGHGDVIAGFIVGSAEFIATCRSFGILDMTGACMSPFNAFLIARGLKTLNIRMERHSASAMAFAKYLEAHPAVAKVYYPGLESFEGHEVAKKQMSLFGGMIAIELKADKATTAAALNKLQLAKIAVSLGDAETLVEHPATMTHATYSKEELAAAGISEGLVRISVGLEDVEDIIADFEQAFASIM